MMLTPYSSAGSGVGGKWRISPSVGGGGCCVGAAGVTNEKDLKELIVGASEAADICNQSD